MEDKTRIMVIDDESGFTRLLKLTLEKTGNYRVLEENDATRAFDAARIFLPHLILLDIVMPKMDGGGVASQMQSDPVLRKVPIVFLTAIVSPQEVTPGALIGGFKFLAKPVSLAALTKCIKENVPSLAA